MTFWWVINQTFGTWRFVGRTTPFVDLANYEYMFAILDFSSREILKSALLYRLAIEHIFLSYLSFILVKHLHAMFMNVPRRHIANRT